jgi:hypothetical protein
LTIELADKTVRDPFSAALEHFTTVVVVDVFSLFTIVVFGVFTDEVEGG